MNKQELIEGINDLDEITISVPTDDGPVGINYLRKPEVLELVKQIEKLKKLVVPQYVADFYESIKGSFEWSLYSLCIDFHRRELQEDLFEWFKLGVNKPIETLVKMKLHGYEVEKEKLYTVEIPNPNSAGGKTILSKQQSTGRLILEMLNSDINKPKYLHLTEAEIKQDFEWAWPFAEEVEE